MVTPDQIALHLQSLLPLLTDRFHDELPVTSGLVSSGILTLTFPTDHGLVVDQQIFLNSALIRNELTAAALTVDNTVRYTTKDVHDLTAFMSERPGRQWPDGKSVTLELPAGNQVVTLDPTEAGVPANNMFEGEEGSIVPAITGNEYLLENRSEGVVGFKTISAVPTSKTIEIDLSDVPAVPDGPLVIGTILTSIRVSIVADIERAKKLYSKQGNNKDYLFVIMLDREPSKNRENDDDFTSTPESTLKKLFLRQEFSTLVVMPVADDLGGGVTKSFAYVDLYTILIRCLHGWQKTGANGDGQAEYNTGFYAHAYDWESRQEIDFEDGFQNINTVAFRELVWTQTIFDEGDSNANVTYP